MIPNPKDGPNGQHRLQQQPKTYFIRYSDKVDVLKTEELAFAQLANVPASDTAITFRIDDKCASKLRRAIGNLGDSSWSLQSTGQADNVAVKTGCLAQLSVKLRNEHRNGLEIVTLVNMYGEVCDVLAGEIQQRKVNNLSDLTSHAVFLVPFEQFIALIIGRSPGATPLEELLTALAEIIASASRVNMAGN
jgi:hypothetical protein